MSIIIGDDEDEYRPIARLVDGKKKTQGIVRYCEKTEDLDGEPLEKFNLMDYPPLRDCKFQITEDTTRERDVVYIAAMAGAGKSFLAGQYMAAYRKRHPKADIYIFSEKLVDPVLDAIPGVIRIELYSKKFIYDDVKAYTFSNAKYGSLCLFDDCGCIVDPNVRQKCLQVMNSVIELGRSLRISCIFTNHSICEGQMTSKILNECHMMVLFPSGSCFAHMERAVMNYFGCDREMLETILEHGEKSRWVAIFKGFPKVIVTEKAIEILKRKRRTK